MARVNYAEKFPKGLAALTRLEQELAKSSLEPALDELVRIRVSEINGCGFCLAMHHRDARAHGESQTRLDTVAGWREAPFYSEREQAALAWAETLTLLSERGAPDADYEAVAAVFSPDEVAVLTFAIVAINSWNRLAVGLRSDVMALEGLDLPGDAASTPTSTQEGTHR